MTQTFTIDTHELTAFLKRLTSDELRKEMERKALEDLANQVLTELVIRTPFKTGQLKTAWRIYNTKVVAFPTSTGYECILVNPTFYASWVEYGHRAIPGQFIPSLKKRVRKTTTWVKGRFFITATCLNFENGKAEKIITDHILKWIESMVKGT